MLSFFLSYSSNVLQDVTTSGHSNEIDRTIMEAFKLKSTSGNLTSNFSAWVHDLPDQVGYGHPLRKVKTVSEQSQVALIGNIVSPCGLSCYLRAGNFYSAEGEPLLVRSHPEVTLQEMVEFPTIGRVFPFNLPRQEAIFHKHI